MLSSVYFKPPEAFVKKIRDRINERLDLDNEDEEAPATFEEIMGPSKTEQKEEIIDSTGVKRSEYAQEAEASNTDYQAYAGGHVDLLGIEEPTS